MQYTQDPKICLIIPAYNPDHQLLRLVKQLAQHPFQQIIINDGSDASCQACFTDSAHIASVTVLKHSSNQGKGAALKTAFQYILDHHPTDFMGIITLDADGQHALEDILKIAHALIQTPNKVILGVRDFGKSIPWRSKFGNTLTRTIFKWIYKAPIEDTQTGLRGIPIQLLPSLVELPSNRYEFELECLVQFAKNKVPMCQIPIATIYVNDNESSHFNPVLDSFRIYFVFLRFIIISILSFLIDFSLFVILHTMGANILTSVILARLFSSIFNFYNNKINVYKSPGIAQLKKELISYFILALFIVSFSYIAITLLHNKLGVGVILSKIIVDAFLFIISFVTQKNVVFRIVGTHPKL